MAALVRGGKIRRMQATLWYFAHRFVLIVGIGSVGYAAYSYLARNVYQAYENRVFDRTKPARSSASSKIFSLPHTSTPSLIGRISIPRLGISAIVKEGVDPRTLDRAVGHIPSSALPGQRGNVAVAAHRDTIFRNLKDVQRNDEITVTTSHGSYVYRVISSTVVNPNDVSVLAPSAGDNTLTLVTCYPFYFVGQAPKRFIVRAKQVGLIPHSSET